MILNDKAFKIYKADNSQSILERIASDMKTVPYWVSINNAKLEPGSVVTAVNILDDLKINISDFANFKDVETKYKNWIDEDDSHDIKNLAELFVYLYVEKDDWQTKLMLESMFYDEGGSEFGSEFIEKVNYKS